MCSIVKASTVARWLPVIVAVFAIFGVGRAEAAVILNCATLSGSISATPAAIALGSNSTLNWSVTGSPSCPLRLNGQPVAFISSLVVSPQTQTVYILTTSQLGGGEHEI